MTQISKPTSTSRIELVDVLRGLALVAMTIYHFTWDLEFFGWAPPAYTLQTGWMIFARCIASSFLFLVGVSLFLSHHQTINWRGFWKRFLMLCAAAALISLVTFYAVPGGFIFFGILHAIALFSLFGLMFVSLHWAINLAAGAAVLAVWNYFNSEIFAAPYFWWVGLAPIPPHSNDYVPLFPWFSAVLFGIAAAGLFKTFGVWEKLSKLELPSLFATPLTFLGRYSLAYYLIHQPIMLGAIWLFTTIVGEPDKTPVFVHQCKIECGRSQGDIFCTPYCTCMAETLKKEKLFYPFLNRDLSDNQTTRLYEVRDMCVAAQQ